MVLSHRHHRTAARHDRREHLYGFVQLIQHTTFYVHTSRHVIQLMMSAFESVAAAAAVAFVKILIRQLVVVTGPAADGVRW